MFDLMATMHQPNHMTLQGKNTYEFFWKVLSTPMSGISPEKKLVDKFLIQQGRSG
jgi:hypothetical protein